MKFYRKSLALILALGLSSTGANADMIANTPLYAKALTASCLQLASATGDRKAALQQAGFASTILGWRQNPDQGVFIVASPKPDGWCVLRFGNVGPNGALVRAAIDVELARLGYRPTGQTVPTPLANQLNGSSAHNADLYAKGKQLIMVEQGGPSYEPQSFGIQRYSK